MESWVRWYKLMNKCFIYAGVLLAMVFHNLTAISIALFLLAAGTIGLVGTYIYVHKLSKRNSKNLILYTQLIELITLILSFFSVKYTWVVAFPIIVLSVSVIRLFEILGYW